MECSKSNSKISIASADSGHQPSDPETDIKKSKGKLLLFRWIVFSYSTGENYIAIFFTNTHWNITFTSKKLNLVILRSFWRSIVVFEFSIYVFCGFEILGVWVQNVNNGQMWIVGVRY